jgi:hypothetical protein
LARLRVGPFFLAIILPIMCALRQSDARAKLAFEDWKMQLRHDCELQDTLRAFDAMGDSVLLFLWRRGLDPTVKAIIEDDPDFQKRKAV